MCWAVVDEIAQIDILFERDWGRSDDAALKGVWIPGKSWNLLLCQDWNNVGRVGDEIGKSDVLLEFEFGVE